MLDFRIHTFLAVCQCLNFTKAAQMLNITQPAVSQHIRYLEEFYGVKLFDYQGKRLSLTAAGEALREMATTMKHDTIHLKAQLAEWAQNKRQLVFGVTLTIGEFVMPEPLAAYLSHYPDTTIRMVVANTQDLLRQLNSGAIDFALVEGFFTKSEYDHRVYAKEPYIAICSSDHEFIRPPFCFEDLLSQRLILREPGSGSREILEKQLAERNLTVHDFANVVEISNIGALKRLVQLGTGIAFLYEAAVREELANGSLRALELSDFQVYHDFTFLWRRGSVFSTYYQELFELLQQK